MKRIPILIADEHLQVRAQISARLRREADFEIVGLADTGFAAVHAANETHPSIILIDPALRDGMGLDAIRRLRAEQPNAEIVVLTAYTDTAQKIELTNLGVRFILNKGIESKNLVEQLRKAADSSSSSHP